MPFRSSTSPAAPPHPARRRLRLALLASSAALLLLALVLVVEKHAPPECARLLPESDAILYLNLSPLRAATHFDRRPVPRDPDYQRFINATGVDFERDLDQAAFALHRTADPLGPNGPVAWSEVFSGHYDHLRLAGYLERSTSGTETYAGHTVYQIPSAGRTVRVALLGSHLVAISNTPSAEQMHSMLDRYRTGWLPFGGPTLLTTHYHDVPLLSLAWGLGQIGLPFADHGEFRVLGLTLPFRLDATFVASLRWVGLLRLRLEEIAPNETAAAASAASMQGLLSVARIAENTLPGALGGDANAQALLNSATVTQSADRAVLTATLPTHFLDRLLAVPDATAPAAPAR